MLTERKKIIHVVIIIIFVCGYFNATPVSALNPLPTQALQGTDIFTFADLGVEGDVVMKGPYESTTIKFELPPTWQLQDGSEINLVIESFFSASSSDSHESTLNTNANALLEVSFNGRLQQNILLTSSSTATTYRIPISASDLGLPDENGFYSITLSLDASIDCDLDFHKTTVVIGANSYAYFPHSEKPLELDLRKLPYPIYQSRAKSAGSAYVVLPTNATADEVQAALVVMGTLGHMSLGKLIVSTITADQLTDTIRSGSDLIFVGKSTSFGDFFAGLANNPLTNGQLLIQEANGDDGLIQILPSPWNPAKSLLLVSGNSDFGVVKSSQALSTGNLQTGTTPDYSIVEQVNPIPVKNVVTPNNVSVTSPDDVTFAGLNYPVITVDELGVNYLSYTFDIPQGQVPSENPYVELKYSNSVLVDPARSYASVFLNGVVVGSLEFSEDETSSLVSTRIDIPASLLKFGINLLDIEVNLIPRDECSLLSFSGLWATIYNDSFIHLPLIQTPISANAIQDLKGYPYPFANDPSLATTTFVVPAQDSFAWASAGKLAFDLGARINGSIISFETAYDNEIPESLQAGNFIMVGEPKNFSVLGQMKDAMPAYFESGKNTAILESQLVIYHVSDQKSLGYLELFPSPWNPQAAVLGVFGTNSDGLNFALNSLLNFQIRDTLSGNFSTYDGGNRAIIVDTRTGYGIGGFQLNVGEENVSVVTPQATGGPSSTPDADLPAQNTPSFILAAIAFVIIGMMAVIFFAFRSKKKS